MNLTHSPARLRNLSFAFLLLLGALLPAACDSTVIDPSDAKVRLDQADRLRQNTQGLADFSRFTIDKREILAEDRVKFHVTMTFKADKARIDQYLADRRQSQSMWGTDFRSARRLPSTAAQQIDGLTQQVVISYRLNKHGPWEFTQTQGAGSTP